MYLDTGKYTTIWPDNFFLENKKSENLLGTFRKIKGLILNFESETKFQDFRKNNHHFGPFSAPFSLEINFLPANFLIECSRTTIKIPI